MLSTLEKMRQDADRFASLYGLENPFTISLYRKLEEAEEELDEAAISHAYEREWNALYARYEAIIKNDGAINK